METIALLCGNTMQEGLALFTHYLNITDMKQATIQALGGNWLINGINFDVSQYSKKGIILNVTDMINFANLNIVSIVNKDVLKAELKDKLKY